MFFKRLYVGEISLPSSGPRRDRMGEVEIVTSLNTFVYDVINFLYVQNLALASKMKTKKKRWVIKKRNVNKCKGILIKGLSANRFIVLGSILAAKILTPSPCLLFQSFTESAIWLDVMH